MYQSLQAARAAAAILVTLFHLGGTFARPDYFNEPMFDRVFSWGDSGVEFFFVLSGFLITSVHRRDFGNRAALHDYAFKRLLRIYPTYWVVCAAVTIAAFLAPNLRGALPDTPASWLMALALVPQDPAMVGGSGSPILFVAWSLQYEMLFYLLFGCVIYSVTAGFVAAAALLLISAGCQIGMSCGFPLAFVDNPLPFLFAMGVACAYVVSSDWRVPKPTLLATAALAAFVALGAFEVVYGRDVLPLDRRWVYGGFAALAIVALVRAEASGELVVRNRWAGLLGDASYALYLLHIPVISLLSKVVRALHVAHPALLVLAYLLILLACVATAVVFHLTLEKPMLRWFRRRFGGGVDRGAPVDLKPSEHQHHATLGSR